MLVIASIAGQTCNQLWSYALHCQAKEQLNIPIHFSPLSIHEGIDIIQGAELPSHLFGSRKLLNYITARKKGAYRLMHFISRIGRITGRPIHFLDNWKHLNWLMHEMGRNEVDLLDYFTFQGLEQGQGSFVSLHARLGDYKTWRDGKYYRTPAEYVQLAQDISQHHNHTRVLIHTNEPHHFQGLPPNVQLSNASGPVEDLTMMAQADIIYGPPSTFSMTASNIGRTPLKWLIESNWSAAVQKSATAEVATGFYWFQTHGVRDLGSRTEYQRTADLIPSIWSTERTKLKS